ncbi:WAT1-related protein At1g09380 [Cajanus cajan]|uniref:WAT1-related protein At1g09380 n=1 Tax=Cajanus cajan TaxID=3821 RepID=UPI00098DA39D|nr:WAT1-related protein At1g09380 [Cajanus cajan]
MAGAGFVPFLLMVLVQFVYAGMNITSKLAIQSGMNPLILVAYRQLFATVSIVPFAYWLEWNNLPRMTKPLMFRILLSSMTGVTGNQVLYFVGLKYSTATIACALTNLLPAFTFVLAILFRQENLKIKKRSGLAKVFGTILCVSGALLLSFYHGKTIGLGQSSIHWKYAEKMEANDSSGNASLLIGPLAFIGSTLVWAGWFIIQVSLSDRYPAPYTSTSLMCLLASFQCVIIALCFDHSASGWSLHNAMRLSSALYAGVMCTALAYGLMSWTIERKGPLYVSVYTPLQLVLTAILSWALLREKLYAGTAIGSLLIVLGLYSVLWGKREEKKEGVEDSLKEAMKDSEKDPKNETELQSYVPSNGNH